MLVDLNYLENGEVLEVKFFNKELNNKNDFELALQLLEMFAGDFNINPEIDIADLKNLSREAILAKKDGFIFFISEEMIESEV